MITPLPTVSFQAVLKDDKKVKVQYAQEGSKIFAAMYYITIDAAEPVLFDLRKAVEPGAKTSLEEELLAFRDKRLRTATVKRVLSQVSTDFILKNRYQPT